MKRPLALLLIFAISFVVPSAGAGPLPGSARSTPAAVGQDDQQDNQQDDQGYDQQGDQYDTYFSAEELENLVAPVALYPDPLLAQVLLAATFPDQIDEAARTTRGYSSDYGIDSAPWDVSVKAVAHYPTVLSMMADKIDWTTSLGQAYVNQSTDLMDAVQRLRRQARSYGYLNNSTQQEIVDTDGYLYIYPEQPQYIYVPVYDPGIVFVARPGFHVGPAIFFSTGFLIGAWLNHDCDWGGHRVFYHGWEGGPSWIQRSRSHVRITNIYVTNNYRNVVVNRRVNDRHVNYGALNRYNTVHHDVDYNNVRRERRSDAGSRAGQPRPGQPTRGDTGPRPGQPRPEQPRPGQPSPGQPSGGDDHRDNKIIRRNIDPNDPRIDANRGHGQANQSSPPVRQPDVRQPNIQQPDDRRRDTPPQPQVRQPDTPRPDVRRPDNSRPVPATTLPAQVPRTDQAPPPQRQPDIQRPPSVFRGNAGGGGAGGGAGAIDTRAASQRGHESRQQQNQVAPQQAPRQQAPNPQHGQQDKPRGRGR
jgi:hypothetical protein